jgi:hypothetical protein
MMLTIAQTATILDRVVPIMNLKASDGRED